MEDMWQLEWDFADRLAKSLRVSDVGVQEMADYLGVGRNTVGAWLAGRNRPQGLKATLTLWSEKTGVPYKWLRYGDDANRLPPQRLSEVAATLRLIADELEQ